MAGANKKRKKVQQPVQKPVSKNSISPAYEKFYERTIRKHLLFIGVEEDLFDRLTKRTRREFMNVRKNKPVFLTKEGHTVPRVYLNILTESLHKFNRTTLYYNNPYGYTIEEYELVGQLFDVRVKYFIDNKLFPLDQEEILYPIMKAAHTPEMNDLHDSMLGVINIFISHILNALSRINYRFYSCDEEMRKIDQTSSIGKCFHVFSEEGSKRVFDIDNVSRVGMRLGIIKAGAPSAIWISIRKGKINGGNSKKQLPVYIQGHALQRMKERMNISSTYVNISFLCSFGKEDDLELDTDINGGKLIAVIDHTQLKVGYFAFNIVDDCVLIQSFLPLADPITAEGYALRKMLNLTKKDMNYWKMDKLSFYTDNDLERIPVLKKALVEAGMWHLTEIVKSVDGEYDFHLLKIAFKETYREVEGLRAKDRSKSIPHERKADKLLEKFFSSAEVSNLTKYDKDKIDGLKRKVEKEPVEEFTHEEMKDATEAGFGYMRELQDLGDKIISGKGSFADIIEFSKFSSSLKNAIIEIDEEESAYHAKQIPEVTLSLKPVKRWMLLLLPLLIYRIKKNEEAKKKSIAQVKIVKVKFVEIEKIMRRILNPGKKIHLPPKDILDKRQLSDFSRFIV